MTDVCLDQSRIYSSSRDFAVRVWDCHSGDCLYVLKTYPESLWPFILHVTPSYFIAAINAPVRGCEICIWEPVSGKLVHQISKQGSCTLGPYYGQERTLVTREFNSNLNIDFFEIWDIKTGQILTRFPIGTFEQFRPFHSEGNLLVSSHRRQYHV